MKVTGMETKIIKIDSSNIDVSELKKAAEILREGGLVAFPTETVYGLGANVLDGQAVENIFKAKGRPSDNPLIVHIASTDQVDNLVAEKTELFDILARHFWPGPLTLIMSKSSVVPRQVTGGLDTVGIRFPSHPVARKLIELAGIPVAAPSANTSGKPSTTRPEHVINDLYGKVDVIIDAGESDIGVESTVLDITSRPPVLLRPGGTTVEQIESVAGPVSMKFSVGDKSEVPRSPGMKYRHYSPNAEVILVSGKLENVMQKIRELAQSYIKAGKKVGIMATDETMAVYTEGIVLSVGSRKHPESIAAALFSLLRKFDDFGVDIILAESVEQNGIGLATMNRLLKAAGHNIIKV